MKKKGLVIITAVALVALMALVPTVSAANYVGDIIVTSDPSGATASLYYEGASYPLETKMTPCTFDNSGNGYKTTNNYQIKFSKDGYYTKTVSVYGEDMIDNGKAYVNVTLKAIPTNGYISITSSPSNAMIYVDEYNEGTTPRTVTVDGGTTHTVKLVKDGYLTQTKSVYVPAGGTSSVSMTLTPSTTYGYLAVTSSPSVANIYIDGTYKGQTPMTVTLPTGNHTLALSKSGYTGFQKTITIYEGATSSVYGVLAENPTSAYVNVSSTPTGASVYIDGEFIGVTPSSGALSKEVKANTVHTLMLKASGYETYTTSFNIETGQIQSFSPTLVSAQPTTGTINVSSVPSGALVYIDNVYVGPSPVIEVVSAGTHTVKLASLGYNDSINTVTVSAGQTYPLQVTLTPGSSPTPSSSPFPILGILIGLGAAAVFAGKKLRR